MPLNDYKCSKCDYVIEKLEFISEMDKEHICPKCKAIMEKMFPITSMNFKLVYDNKKDISSWGAEGYSTSQYNRKIEKKEDKE